MTMKPYGKTHQRVLVGNGLVDVGLPPPNEGVLSLVVPIIGRGLLDDVGLRLTVAPDQ